MLYTRYYSVLFFYKISLHLLHKLIKNNLNTMISDPSVALALVVGTKILCATHLFMPDLSVKFYQMPLEYVSYR